MKRHIIRLDKLYNSVNEDVYLKIISSFKPAHNDKDAEIFIRTKALENIKNSKSVTYLSISEKGSILGFYSLGLTYIPVTPKDNISNTLKRKMKSISIDEGSDYCISVAYLIGQLARSKDTPAGFGKELLKDAIEKVGILSMQIGCNIVRIDCSNNETMIGYYKDNDFTEVKDSMDGKLKIMVRVIKRPKIVNKK